MKKFIFAILMLTLLPGVAFGQETSDSKKAQWEPQTRVTGYVSSEYNYFKDMPGFPRDYSFAIGEAGFLVSYQPLEKLAIKSVFVYRPGYSFDLMLNEANAEYKVNDFLNIKGGRFLTPLSPMNTYYYAPVNNSATLPMLISHHEFFPLTMDALSINGKIGNDFKIDYNVFWGGYHNTFRLASGPLGFFGIEDIYIKHDTTNVNYNSELNIGGGAHAGFAFLDYITVGLNYFSGREVTANPFMRGNFITATKDAYGINFKLKYASLQLLGEIWKADISIPLPPPFPVQKVTEKSSFFELSNAFSKITPYARFEYHNDYGFTFNRYTFGVNYKPIFETIFKLEYMIYDRPTAGANDGGQFIPTFKKSGIVASLIFSF